MTYTTKNIALDLYLKEFCCLFLLAYNIYCVGETDGQISPKLGGELV
jgi:hypothetical protein